MSLLTTLNNVLESELSKFDLKYCLVTKDKLPYTIKGNLAKSNDINDFVSLEEIIKNIDNIKVDNYKGLGISIQGSNICAIDIDHCFSIAGDINSADNRAKDAINNFKDDCYIEFSFSGTGLRILFQEDIIENYSDKYYIKNDKCGIEYYQPTKSYRYVTVTGNKIYNNKIKKIDNKNVLKSFLDKYMKKNIQNSCNKLTPVIETRDFEQLLKLVKIKYYKDNLFQNLWFDKAPGSGSNESERDYQLIAYLFEYITQDKDMIKKIFESSPYFQSKDWKHINKWNYGNFRYYNYLYDNIRRIKLI